MRPIDLVSPSSDALLRLAKRHGAIIEESYTLPDGHPAWLLALPSHAAKVALLNDLAELDGFSPWVRRYAERVASGARSRLEQIIRLHAHVRDTVVHTDEPIETFSPTLWTLETKIGDCDDTARALVALLRSLGFMARIATLGDPPKHAAAQVFHEGGWHWLETTVRAEPGEHPQAAANRLGVRGRTDLR